MGTSGALWGYIRKRMEFWELMGTYGKRMEDLWGHMGKRMKDLGLMGTYEKRMADLWELMGKKIKDWGQLTCRSISHMDCKTQCTL